MTSPVDICNIALAEAGQVAGIASFTDGTPASNAASTFFTPKLQMLARSANWDSFRAQAALTLYKATVIGGAVSADPPPQPWNYEYLWPSDCLKLRFLQPTLTTQPAGTPLTTAPTQVINAQAPTSFPFVPAADVDGNGSPIKVILTNVPLAQAIYTRDLTQYPDLWDSLFTAAATALLASYFIAALARNQAQLSAQIAMAKGMIEQARAANANESISNADHLPDWISARSASSVPWAWNTGGPGGTAFLGGGWDACGFPDGQTY